MSRSRLSATVVIPTWNGQDTVAEALRSAEESVLSCEYDVGLVVVDDASSDDTVATVQDFARSADVQITLVRHDSNRGTGAARNTGVAAARADFHLFLDQDDQYLPSHVGLCLDALTENPRVDFVRTGVILDRPVHPHWQAAIADTLVQTLCVRSFAHRLIGGFLEDDAVAAIGCDDVYYSRLLHHFLAGARLPLATARFRCRPGNSFDRQWERKFSRAPEDAEETLDGERLAAWPAAEAAVTRRAFEVEKRLRRLPGPRRTVRRRA